MSALRLLLHGRGAQGLVAFQVIALAPPLAVALWQGGIARLGILLAALLVALAWDGAVSVLRRRPLEPFGITTAILFALIISPQIPLWHLFVVLSLGCVIGELAFGGRGFSFVTPATVALALALLSLPGLTLNAPGTALALACLPGAALLLAAGLLDIRIVASFLAVLALLCGATQADTFAALAIASSLALVFLVGDPTSAAVTPLGRILHGALAGGLAWVFGGFPSAVPGPEAFIFAALVASIFAPLIDHLVVEFSILRRQRHHG